MGRTIFLAEKIATTTYAAETYLTSHEVGVLLQCNPSSVNKWVAEGRIAAHRTPGGHRRITAGDLVAFLERHQMPIPGVLTSVASPPTVVKKKGKKR